MFKSSCCIFQPLTGHRDKSFLRRGDEKETERELPLPHLTGILARILLALCPLAGNQKPSPNPCVAVGQPTANILCFSYDATAFLLGSSCPTRDISLGPAAWGRSHATHSQQWGNPGPGLLDADVSSPFSFAFSLSLTLRGCLSPKMQGARDPESPHGEAAWPAGTLPVGMT